MDPALLGLGTALCWGVADFVARLIGRAVGALTALTAVTIAGAVELTAVLLLTDTALPSLYDASIWAWAASAATMASLWMFYEALRRAPIAVVAPLVGAYPAWALMISVLILGVRPAAETWAAMVGVIVGMWLVGSGHAGDTPRQPGARRLAMLSAATFAVAVLLGQHATAIHGTVETVWFTRVLGGAMLLAVLPILMPVRLTWRWAVVAAAQGSVDTGGYLFLYAAAAGMQAAIATVVSSAFGIVTILLARIFLGERIGTRGLTGIALVFGGVAYLS